MKTFDHLSSIFEHDSVQQMVFWERFRCFGIQFLEIPNAKALELRTNTGVSIVGIERDSERIVNPGPGETLLEGDLLLLLGEDAQLPKAKAELAPTQAD